MLKKIFAVMLATVMGVSMLTACGGSDEDSESSVHANKDERSAMNARAKTIYTISNNFCQKFYTITEGKAVPDFETDILIVEPGEEKANFNNIKSGADKDAIIGEIKKEINSGLNHTADGYVYIIKFEKGFPKTVYISRKDDDSFVGRYPDPMENKDEGAYSLKSFLD